MEFSAQQIAGFLNGIVEGKPGTKVSDLSKIEEGKKGDFRIIISEIPYITLGIDFIRKRKISTIFILFTYSCTTNIFENKISIKNVFSFHIILYLFPLIFLFLPNGWWLRRLATSDLQLLF